MSAVRALGRDRDELFSFVVEEVDGEDRGADQLGEQLLEVPEHAPNAARAEELRGRDIEVREVGELALDLGILRREAVLIRLGAARAGEELDLLVLEAFDLPEQVADRLVARQVGAELAVLALELGDRFAEPLVLLEELLGELSALLEELLNEGVALLLQVLRGTVAGLKAPLVVGHGRRARMRCGNSRARANLGDANTLRPWREVRYLPTRVESVSHAASSPVIRRSAFRRSRTLLAPTRSITARSSALDPVEQLGRRGASARREGL